MGGWKQIPGKLMMIEVYENEVVGTNPGHVIFRNPVSGVAAPKPSKGNQTGGSSCPASHPYVYYNGHYCCQSNREKHYKPQGAKCDGSIIQRNSLCCAGDKFTKCPKGVCSNNKKINKKPTKKVSGKGGKVTKRVTGKVTR